MIAILASLCLGTACHWVTVTTSEQDPNVTMMSCQLAPPALADWMAKNHPGYRMAGWKCVIGRKARGA